MLGLLLVQVTEVLVELDGIIFLTKYKFSPTAKLISFLPFSMLILVGVTFLTLIVTDEEILPSLAVIVTVPVPTQYTTPFETVAI